jgi:hypothetical protein
MTIQLFKSIENEHWIKVSNYLTVSEFQQLQTLGELSLGRFDQFRVLIELEDFQGWSKEPDWEKSFFLTEDQTFISKIAVVGDEQWKDQVFLFMGKGMRKTAIEFFPTPQIAEAKAWLSEEISKTQSPD